jgi:hypothetical protein
MRDDHAPVVHMAIRSKGDSELVVAGIDSAFHGHSLERYPRGARNVKALLYSRRLQLLRKRVLVRYWKKMFNYVFCK